jgi:hypothetical protein
VFWRFPAPAQQSVALSWPLVRFPKGAGMSVSPFGRNSDFGILAVVIIASVGPLRRFGFILGRRRIAEFDKLNPAIPTPAR